jgi:IS5 family transposase
LSLFRALLLATWHDLSDVRLAEALDDRTSFRRELVRRGLDRALFEVITRQLAAKGVMVRTGTLVDATLLPSASIRHDGEARWAGHRRRKPVHGYKAHVATDEGAGLVRSVEVTTANIHDAPSWSGCCRQSQAMSMATAPSPAAPPSGSLSAAVADPARCGPASGAAARRRSPGSRRTTPPCGGSAAGSRRCSAPGSVPTACAGCAGLAKAGLQVRLAAIAYNLRRTLTLLRAMAA